LVRDSLCFYSLSHKHHYNNERTTLCVFPVVCKPVRARCSCLGATWKLYGSCYFDTETAQYISLYSVQPQCDFQSG